MSAGEKHKHSAGASVPERLTLNGRALDRRAFLGAAGLTAAGSLLPWRGVLAADSTGAVRVASQTGAHDWHVDDMWGHWPRYAHPIPYSSHHEPLSWDDAAPADRLFVSG